MQALTALTKVDTWRNLEVGHGPGNEYWTPWVRATLPVGESLRHQWLTVTAGVTLTYPLATGLEVADTSAELSRTLRCSSSRGGVPEVRRTSAGRDAATRVPRNGGAGL